MQPVLTNPLEMRVSHNSQSVWRYTYIVPWSLIAPLSILEGDVQRVSSTQKSLGGIRSCDGRSGMRRSNLCPRCVVASRCVSARCQVRRRCD